MADRRGPWPSLPGSPAIDAGNNDLIPAGVQYDQRGPGFQRIVNATATAATDIGAFESARRKRSPRRRRLGDTDRLAPDRCRRTATSPGGTQDRPALAGINQLRGHPQPRRRSLTPADVTVNSAIGANYGPVTVSGSGTNYTITLARPINAADRVTLTIVNPGISIFNRRIDVVPGDVNDDGVVSASDIVLIRNAIQKTGDPLMIGWIDLDGDGVIDMKDFTAARSKLGNRLP